MPAEKDLDEGERDTFMLPNNKSYTAVLLGKSPCKIRALDPVKPDLPFAYCA